jgi:hypothetical protein
LDSGKNMRITVCGGGNAAHSAVGLLAARNDHQVNVYLSFEEEAERWQSGIESQNGIVVSSSEGLVLGCPEEVSSDPADVIPGSQMVLLALPAFAHESILKEVAPFLDEGIMVGALAARGCFDLDAKYTLGDKSEMITFFGLQTLPWACRIIEYGQEVRILGVKAYVDFATCPPQYVRDMAPTLSEQLGTELEPIDSFLSLTLAGTGQLIHPGVMYGLFKSWDGRPFEEAPLFYQGINEQTADILQCMSDEVQAIRNSLEERFPGIALSAVRPLDEWLCRSYADEIADTSSLHSYFVTNRSYAGLRVPMREVQDGLVPDFRARYLSEDIPYALIATRGIAELAEVQTPTIDRVIRWSQDKLGQEYLVAGELTGRDVNKTRSPQRYGFRELESMVDAMFCK